MRGLLNAILRNLDFILRAIMNNNDIVSESFNLPEQWNTTKVFMEERDMINMAFKELPQ